MNEKFFALPEEKQRAILNAGYRVFANNSYKKSPMSEIASEAGISKALLFHYFHNKKELYLYLWDACAKMTIRELKASGCYGQSDLFDGLYLGMKAKVRLMRQYPYLGRFTMRAFYETDPEVHDELQKSIAQYGAFRANARLLPLDPERFVPGLDLKMMYLDMYWASEGYLWEKLQEGAPSVDEMEKDFMRLIDFWRSIYLRKETET